MCGYYQSLKVCNIFTKIIEYRRFIVLHLYTKKMTHVTEMKKPVAAPKSANWHWHFLALVLAKIQNWKLAFFVGFLAYDLKV